MAVSLVRFWALAVGLIVFSHPAWAAQDAGPLASGALTIGAKHVAAAKGIRTIFISVMDAESSMPMPYGAMKIELTADVAKGWSQKFDLSGDSLMIMRPGPRPKKVVIKAKLDKDGSAGRDAPGDIIGKSGSIEVGKANVAINLDQLIN